MNAAHVYVHVPFCARRCTYCDFAIAIRAEVPVREYLDALAREVARGGDAAEARTLYLGGGTPSLLGAGGIAELLRIVRAPKELEELTLEANPDDITPEAARAWRAAGVTRLSIGVQTFHDPTLAWMNRTHDAEGARCAVRGARAAGFKSISLDLIFALPDALGRSFQDDLAQAIALAPDHISLYGLTVEPGTPLARQVARGETAPVAEDRYEEDYLQAHATMADAGYAFYEVSNAARPGHEALHNSVYWRQVPYTGLGPSAHGFDGTTRRWNVRAYAEWAARLAAGESPVGGEETLTAEQRRLERLYLGLRTVDGVDVAEIGAEKAERWIAEGWATENRKPKTENRLRLTPAGWLRLDSLVASI